MGNTIKGICERLIKPPDTLNPNVKLNATPVSARDICVCFCFTPLRVNQSSSLYIAASVELTPTSLPDLSFNSSLSLALSLLNSALYSISTICRVNDFARVDIVFIASWRVDKAAFAMSPSRLLRNDCTYEVSGSVFRISLLTSSIAVCCISEASSLCVDADCPSLVINSFRKEPSGVFLYHLLGILIVAVTPATISAILSFDKPSVFTLGLSSSSLIFFCPASVFNILPITSPFISDQPLLRWASDSKDSA